MRAALLLSIAGCVDPGPGSPGEGDPSGSGADPGLPVLGSGSHDPERVVIAEVLTASDGLAQPSDLQFHPEVPDQLWITLRGISAMLLVDDPGGPSQRPSLRRVSSSAHFLARPSGLAFGGGGMLATSHEEDRKTQGAEGTPADFMGPTLWSADPEIFDGGDLSHADMLHNSPNATGIAWERDNVYWVFDGYHSSLVRYDFREPHELGGTEHGDGIIQRWAGGEVGHVEGCVSHLAFDPESGLLYVADSGNDRILAVDTSTGSRGELYGPAYDTPDQYLWEDAEILTLVDGPSVGLEMPAGLELSDGLLWVTDAATATVHAFDLEGQPVDWLPLGREPGGLQGLTVGPDGDLWVTDAQTDSVLRIQAE